jgi:hypothetical protein
VNEEEVEGEGEEDVEEGHDQEGDDDEEGDEEEDEEKRAPLKLPKLNSQTGGCGDRPAPATGTDAASPLHSTAATEAADVYFLTSRRIRSSWRPPLGASSRCRFRFPNTRPSAGHPDEIFALPLGGCAYSPSDPTPAPRVHRHLRSRHVPWLLAPRRKIAARQVAARHLISAVSTPHRVDLWPQLRKLPVAFR